MNAKMARNLPGVIPWLVASLLGATTATACGSDPGDVPPVTDRARLTARPGSPSQQMEPGKYDLGLAEGRDGWFYIPQGYEPGTPMPSMVLLHGATGEASNWDGVTRYADSLGMVLLVPESRGGTWDLVRSGFGPDVAFIDAALVLLFDRVDVDATRLALAGFSDGASYSLSLGLANGDLFTHVIGWSPGFIEVETQRGNPGVFISHGTLDPILAIDRTSRLIVPILQQAGYDVVYEEFEGGHTVTAEVAQHAFDWFLAGP